MQRDIRATAQYRQIVEFCRKARQPGTNSPSDASQLHVSPDGKHAVFAATVVDRIEEEPPTRIAIIEIGTGATRLLTHGPNSDRFPMFSADREKIAFISDRHRAGDPQLHILDCSSGVVRAAPRVDGSVESLQWNAAGTKILLGVVGPKRTAYDPPVDLPSWVPLVEPTDTCDHWRSCWVYEPALDSLRRAPTGECNIWGASWLSNDAWIAVTSDGAGEGDWYSASLCSFDLVTGQQRRLYAPRNQVGTPIVSPSGRQIAIVEGLCSDRGPVMGNLILIDAVSGERHEAHTRGVDVLTVEWQSEQHLLLSGTRGFETVVGLYAVASDAFSEVWSSRDVAVTAGCVSRLSTPGDCVLIVEGFTRAPEIGVIRAGHYQQIKSFDVGYGEATSDIACVERMSWPSTDGLEIQGWLPQSHGRPRRR